MATTSEPIDPVDQELTELLHHSKVRERLDAYEAQVRDGKVETIPHDEVRRRLGFPTPDTAPPASD